MKRLLRFVLTFTIALLGVISMTAQTRPVDTNGVKVVCVANGDKLDKHLKGDNKNHISSLIIKDDVSNPYTSSFCEDFFKVLSKLPNLEILDVSGSKQASWELVFNRDIKVKSLNIKKVIVDDIYGGDYEYKDFHIDDMDYIVNYDNFIGKMGSRDGWRWYIDYPSIQEFTIKNIHYNNIVSGNDSLRYNVDYNGFTPILLPKEDAICFKKNIMPGPCEISLEIRDVIKNRDGDPINIKKVTSINNNLVGTIICDNSFIQDLAVDTLFIPSSVQRIIPSRNGHSGSANVVVFEKGVLPVLVENESMKGLNIKKSVIFNRPATVQYAFHDMDSIVFNKAASLTKDSNRYFNGFYNVEHLVFNDTAIINKGCGGGGYESIIFNGLSELEEESFEKAGTIKFEKMPKIAEKYGFPKVVYVPMGAKTNFPRTGDYSHPSPKIYEILPEKSAKDMITRTLELNTPGSLLSVISPSDLAKVDSLTIVGMMNEADAKVLTELATTVSYLNLRDCITQVSDLDFCQ